MLSRWQTIALTAPGVIFATILVAPFVVPLVGLMDTIAVALATTLIIFFVLRLAVGIARMSNNSTDPSRKYVLLSSTRTAVLISVVVGLTIYLAGTPAAAAAVSSAYVVFIFYGRGVGKQIFFKPEFLTVRNRP